jgi:hypothetical protein
MCDCGNNCSWCAADRFGVDRRKTFTLRFERVRPFAPGDCVQSGVIDSSGKPLHFEGSGYVTAMATRSSDLGTTYLFQVEIYPRINMDPDPEPLPKADPIPRRVTCYGWAREGFTLFYVDENLNAQTVVLNSEAEMPRMSYIRSSSLRVDVRGVGHYSVNSFKA